MKEKTPPPAWSASATAATDYAPALAGHMNADVVVIGAGITGSSAALHLAQAGKSVIQLEAHEPGWGASGRAFGNVVPVSKHSEDDILETYGPRRGERINRALADGPRLVGTLINDCGMDALVKSDAWLLTAHSPQARARLCARAERLAAGGEDVAFIEEGETERLVGSAYYKAGMLDRRAIAIRPYAYTQGLARAARNAGVHQYWHSAVTAIEKDGAMWRVSSADGTVRAACVMICTNAYGGNVWPDLARAYIPVRGYSVISRPISDNLYESILPYNHFITDTRNLWSGIRKLPGNRLHLSTGGSALRADAKANFDEASSRLKDVFPHIGHVNWDGQSSGWIAITPKQLPKILRLADGVFTAFGYSGRGISFATLLGRELAKLPDDRSGNDLLLPVESMRPLPFHRLAPFVAAAWIQWYGLRDRFTLRRVHGTGRRP
jgi:glycine/D-amino acid oxidase-like deaminating enzyme